MVIGYNITSRPRYPRETTPLAMEYESGWATEGVWTFWRREKFLASAGIRYAGRLAHSLVSTSLPTTLLNGKGHLHLPASVIMRKEVGTHRIFDWVGSEPLLDVVAKIRAAGPAGTRTFS